MTDKPFIVVEGVDGSGKTTLLSNIFVFSQFATLYETKEPYFKKTKIALKNKELTNDEKTKIFLKDRKKHLKEVIIPVLKTKTVLCDRYNASTVAYQALNEEDVVKLHDKMKHFLTPDLTIFIDLKPEDAVKRIKERNQNDELDEYFLNNIDRIYKNYKQEIELEQKEGNEVLILNGNLSQEKMIEKVIQKIEELFPKENMRLSNRFKEFKNLGIKLYGE